MTERTNLRARTTNTRSQGTGERSAQLKGSGPTAEAPKGEALESYSPSYFPGNAPQRENVRVMRGNRFGLRVFLAAVLFGLTSLSPAADAMDDRLNAQASFNIPAQPLGTSLKQLADQAGIQILFEEQVVSGLRAPAVKTYETPLQVLNALLKGTGLEFAAKDSTIAVRKQSTATTSTTGENQQGNAGSTDQRYGRGGAAESSTGFLRVAQADTPSSSNSPTEQQVRSSSSKGEKESRQTLEEVLVTGSRIRQASAQSMSPITTVSQEDLQISGTTRVEDLLNSLPQASADYGANIGNRSTGTATVNLRNLGNNRTLVLIDGRRLMPGDPTAPGNVPDLNAIPAALVSHVDILTGGASAVYGSDAVAGVVNFIMMKNFSGFRIDAQTSIYQHNNDNGTIQNIINARAASSPEFKLPDSNVRDGAGNTLSLTWGVNSADGNGNVTAYASYRRIQPVLQTNRDYGSCALSSGATFRCGGSGANATGQFLLFSDPTFSQVLGDLTVDRKTGNTLKDFTSADKFNTAPLNYYQRPDQRISLGAFGHYEFNKSLDVYTQLMAMDDRTTYQLAPTGIFGLVASIDCANPFLSAQEQNALCVAGRPAPATSADMIFFRRNAEGGGRAAELRHTSSRIVIGARGELNDAWNYDVYGQYGVAVYTQDFMNDFSLRRVSLALDAVRDPGTGNIVCRAALTGIDPSCVPYNPFTLGAVTPAMLNYLQVPGFLTGSSEESVVNASVNGDLAHYGVKTPWANEGLGLVLGSEYRRESLDLRTDAEFSSRDLSSFTNGIQGQKGGYSVSELFTEARLPVVEHAPWAKLLSVEAGYRYSKYENFTTNTYKFGSNWAPLEDISFRGGYQRAARAPNIYELFSASTVALDGVTDPCAGPTPSASATACARTGVLPGQYGNILASPSSQYNGLVGGNTKLREEDSDSYTVGFLVTPRVLPGFSLAVDWFDIKVKGAISTIGADLILQRCLASGDPFLCSKIHRSPGTGSLWLQTNGFVTDTNTNAGSVETGGIDTDANYRTHLADIGLGNRGSLAVSFVGTWTRTFRSIALPGDTVATNCSGFYGPVCGTPTPTWRHKMRVTWETPWKLATSVTWRRINGLKLGTEEAPAAGPATDVRISAIDYLDLAATYPIADKVTLRMGVNNFLDKAPPLIGSANLPVGPGNGNTFAQFYDSLGRFGFFGFVAQF